MYPEHWRLYSIQYLSESQPKPTPATASVEIADQADYPCQGRDLRVKKIVMAALVALVTLALAACSDTSPEHGSSSRNQQDAIFAYQLSVLSEQLVQITDVMLAASTDAATQKQLDALGVTANERVALARTWLAANGRSNVEPVATPGRLTSQQFENLTTSTGSQFASAVTQAAEIQAAGMREICNQEIEHGENAQLIAVAKDLLARVESESQVLKGASV
jgi:hypothetical protein